MARKFGVEIEALNLTMARATTVVCDTGLTCTNAGYSHAVSTGWKVVSDASVTDGFELVSPILEGERGLADTRTAAKALADEGATVDRRCGLHVHVDARDMTLPMLKNLMKMWVKYETAFDVLVPASRRNNTYCKSIADHFADDTAAFKAIDAATSVVQLRNAMNPEQHYTGSGRYHKLNLHAMVRHGTVEFRQHSGTVDAQKIAEWVALCVAFVDEAARATTIKQNKPGTLIFENLIAHTTPPTRKYLRARRAALAGDAQATN